MQHTNAARRFALWCLAVFAALRASGLCAETPSVEQLIQLAGNADSDVERLRYLKQLQSRQGLDPKLKADLDKLVASIERWNGKKLPYFGRKTRKMEAELYLLEKGTYDLLGNGELLEQVKVTGARTRITFELPPRVEFLLEIKPSG